MGIIRFGTDGWRARVGEGLDEAHVVRIVDAIARLWARHREGARVMVGFDTRRDSQRLACRAAEALAAAGLESIVSLGPCPTPALCLAVARDEHCIGALMLTAMEASCELGGLVAFRGDGGPVSEGFADAVEQTIKGRPSLDRGTYDRADFVTPYRDALLGLVAPSVPQRAKALRVVVDTMYGTGISCAAEVFRRLGCDVVSIHDQMAPDFRGLHPDVREPWVDQCERAVLKEGADLGVVIDGDARHAAIIDERGRLVSFHDLAPLVMRSCVRQGRDGRVVGTYATSARLRRQAELLDCEFTMVPVGFDAIYREFHEQDVMLGADANAGVCVPAHLPERDGLLAATMACMQLAGGKSARDVLEEQHAVLGPCEWGVRTVRLDAAQIQRLRNVLPGVNPELVAGMEPQAISHGDGLRVGLPDGSWLLVRPARTRPGVRVVAEAPSARELSQLLRAGVELVQHHATVQVGQLA